MGLSQQPLGIGWIAWFALIPLISILIEAESIKEHIKIGFIWGVVYHVVTIYWLAFNIGTTFIIGIISTVGAVLFLSLNTIAICILFFYLRRRIRFRPQFLIPIIWTSVEYFRSFGVLGFPWVSLANSQTDYLVLAQNVEFLGIYGISFWILFLNVMGYQWIENRGKTYLYRWGLFFILPWLTGYMITPNHSPDVYEKLEVIVVQPNVHISQKRQRGAGGENIRKLMMMSMRNMNEETDLIIWPETSTISYILNRNNAHMKFIQKNINETGISLITGVPYYEGNKSDRKYYNSVVLIKPDFPPTIYHKLHLVPMAEYIPLSPIFESLKKLNLGQANFEPGKDYTLLEVGHIKIASMVCFESTFPQLNRNFINAGAQVLVYVVNDGWYETAPEPQQHAKQSIYRAIEFRRPVIRCANTGVSQVINASGNIQRQLELNDTGVITASVIPSSEITFYTKYGDVFAILNLFVLLILMGFIPKKND